MKAICIPAVPVRVHVIQPFEGLINPIRHAVGAAEPYTLSAELHADLVVLSDSLTQHGAALIAGGRLRRLVRAVQLFGFHLAPVDLRQEKLRRARAHCRRTARPCRSH